MRTTVWGAIPSFVHLNYFPPTKSVPFDFEDNKAPRRTRASSAHRARWKRAVVMHYCVLAKKTKWFHLKRCRWEDILESVHLTSPIPLVPAVSWISGNRDTPLFYACSRKFPSHGTRKSVHPRGHNSPRTAPLRQWVHHNVGQPAWRISIVPTSTACAIHKE